MERTDAFYLKWVVDHLIGFTRMDNLAQMDYVNGTGQKETMIYTYEDHVDSVTLLKACIDTVLKVNNNPRVVEPLPLP